MSDEVRFDLILKFILAFKTQEKSLIIKIIYLLYFDSVVYQFLNILVPKYFKKW